MSHWSKQSDSCAPSTVMGQCQLRSGEGGTWRFAGLMGQRQLRSGESGTQTQGAAEDGSVSRSIPFLALRWWPGRGCGPGLQTPQVRAGDDPGKDAQTAPQRLLLLGGVRRRPLVSRWVPSVGPSHSAPSRGSRRQPCGRRSRRVSASSLQCERRDGRSEPPMRGCMYVPRHICTPGRGSAVHAALPPAARRSVPSPGGWSMVSAPTRAPPCRLPQLIGARLSQVSVHNRNAE